MTRRMGRRSFIKHAGAGGLSLTALQGLKETAIPKKNKRVKKIIVAGAGIGGLCCGYELMKLGHEVLVLEASGRFGGHVFTARDGLSDGLYGDYGQEHITKPGYEIYRGYIQEFGLEALPYPRRINELIRIDGKLYTLKMLSDPAVLGGFGFNKKEIDFLAHNSWYDLELLYKNPYLEKFTDEYQPFGIGYDDLDKISMADVFIKDGASKGAMRFLGGENGSALTSLWGSAILKLRGVPTRPTDLYRLKGGNQMLPNAFAKRLGQKVLLDTRILSVAQESGGVTVNCRQHNKDVQYSADYLVNCIPLTSFRNIPVTPALPPERQYIFDQVTYDSYQRFVFQASSKFWIEDGYPINMSLDHPDLWEVWQSADEVDTNRAIILGTGPGGVSPQRALAAFREVYPGKRDTIEQAISKDWTKDSFSPSCERTAFPIGQLHKFWPALIQPQGRIYFAGAYADNLNWGTEAATRSANRVAKEIDNA
jgi:monoamine oxidase